MKDENVLLLLVLLFISIIIACLIINGEPVKEERNPTVIDSEIKCDTIKDGYYLT